MLGFFRRYEKYFFVVITFVIVISFTFFGTYGTLTQEPSQHDREAFQTVNGRSVSEHQLEVFSRFIATDNLDKVTSGGAWGPNFLNSGVIQEDLLQTGLALLLVADYKDQLREDLAPRHEKEKKYVPYSHPSAKFVGAVTAWQQLAPEIKFYFDQLQASGDPVEEEALVARIRLFMAEKRLPAPLLYRVIRQQEKQQSWLTPDSRLGQVDLALFNYRTVEDWFGPRFVRLVAEFIINTAEIAKQKGYQVSETEAFADLIRNAELSYQQNSRNPNLGVANTAQYMTKQLKILGIDQTQAVKVWQQVLLFRRYFLDVGRSAFVDPFTIEQLNSYAAESVEGVLYQLPTQLRLGSYRELQRLEIYLDAVANPSPSLTLPTLYYAPSEVARKNPELVQKQYRLKIASVDKERLQAKIGVKETWDWEVEDANWRALTKEFPELGVKGAKNREERFAALEGLDRRTRGRVDAFARTAIVDSHPEWLEETLAAAPASEQDVGISRRGGSTPFAGLERRQKLISLLDKAPLGKEDPALKAFTADNKNYYRIIVLERDPKQRILTFAEASREGILDTILDRNLQTFYIDNRLQYADDFQLPSGGWKPFESVKLRVADHYFADKLKAIKAKAPKGTGSTGDLLAAVRLHPHLAAARTALKRDPKAVDRWVATGEDDPLKGQWKLIQRDYSVSRGSEESYLNKEAIFAISEGEFGQIKTLPNGDLTFFQLTGQGTGLPAEELEAQVYAAYGVLTNEAQRELMRNTLVALKEKRAISLDYMHRNRQNME